MFKAFLQKWIGDIRYDKYLSILFGLIGKLSWPLTVVFLAFLFQSDVSMLINRIDTIKKGDMTVGLGAAAKELRDISKSGSTGSDKQVSDALVNLASLLSEYKYAWSAWTLSQAFSHEVRFADRYSGPGAHVRFIDEYVKDLDNYDKRYGSVCPPEVKKPLAALNDYLKGVLPYQIEGQKLSAPVFSMPKYLSLFTTLVDAITSASKVKGSDTASDSRIG